MEEDNTVDKIVQEKLPAKNQMSMSSMPLMSMSMSLSLKAHFGRSGFLFQMWIADLLLFLLVF